MVENLRQQGGLQFHESEIEMELSQSNLFLLRKASKPLRARILDEFCQVCGYHCKYAIRLLSGPAPTEIQDHPQGSALYLRCQEGLDSSGHREPAEYPCSTRLKLYCRYGSHGLSSAWGSRPKPKSNLCRSVPLPLDRRLKPKKRQLKKRLHGRTKPGTSLKHHIPIKTDSWSVTTQALQKPS
jgi:hypothetical protein